MNSPLLCESCDALLIPPAVAESLRYCRDVTRSRARNFYYGLRLTPEPKRSALYALYAYMRACDDAVDGDAASAGTPLRRIEELRHSTDLAVLGAPNDALPEGPIWPAVRYAAQRFGIESSRLHEMLDGQQMDLTTTRYATFDDLYTYCRRVASVVGLACLDIWGHDGNPGVEQLAEERGIALQLTNVLRDLAEDAARGRIYLPLEDLARFGISESQLLSLEPSPQLERLLRFQAERARQYYDRTRHFERHLPSDCRATSWTMMAIYRELLDRIARDPLVVTRRRIGLSPLRKLVIAARGTLRRKWA